MRGRCLARLRSALVGGLVRALVKGLVMGLVVGLAAAWLPPPASALVLPRFGGFKGGSHSTPHGDAPELPGGARSHGGSPIDPPPRRVEPEWLRGGHERASAAAAADDPLLQRQAEAANQQAGGRGDHTINPWPAAPHLRVRVSGRPDVDGPRLQRLAEQLGRPINPDRLRVVSLADDTLADGLLADALGRNPAQPERQWAQALRRLRSARDAADTTVLTGLLRPLQGQVLLVMAHVDTVHSALVFKGARGRTVQVPISALERAATDAGVQLLLVGCRSGRHASAGFADNLNSLDAAHALLRTQRARPASMFDLFAALSSDRLTMLVDPLRFETLHQVTLHQDPNAPPQSTVHWLGGTTGPAAALAAAPAASQPAPAPVLALATRTKAWLALPALHAVAALASASLLAGVALAWPRRLNTADWAYRGVWSIGLHLAAPLLWLAVLAEAIGGADDVIWRWAAAAVGLAGSGWQLARWRDAALLRPAWALGLLRWALPSAPLLVVLALAEGGWRLPAPWLLDALRALYVPARELPHPWMLAAVAAATAWLLSLLLGGVDALVRGVRGVRTAWARRLRRRHLSQHMTQQLAQAGVLAVHAPLHARLALEADLPEGVAWHQLQRVTRFQGPDPWTGVDPQRWQLVRLPLPPQIASGGPGTPHAVWGLMRMESAFLHPLPQALVQRWEALQLPSHELPVLLARVEGGLRRGDFRVPPARRRLPYLLPLLGAVLASGAGWMASASSGDERLFWWALAALAGSTLALWPLQRWARARRHQAWLARQRVGPGASPGADAAAPA